jgi:hypothetical protein
MPYSWLHNSSLTVAFDNLRTLLKPRPNQFQYMVTGTIIRFVVAGAFVWLFVHQRSRVPAGPSRRHLDFMVAVTAGLLLMPVVWAHYLVLLYIPLSYCLAVAPSLPRQAVYLLALVLLGSIIQNVAVVNALNTLIAFDTWLELFVIGLVKSAPLWLTASLLAAHRRDVLNAYAYAEWKGVEADVAARQK